MNPSIQAFLNRLDSTLMAHSTSIAAIQASTAKIDELAVWRPDQEKHVVDLSTAVSALQRAQHPSSSAPTVALLTEKGTSPASAMLGTPMGPEAGAGGTIHGSADQVSLISRGGCRWRHFRRRHHSQPTVSPRFPPLLFSSHHLRMRASYWRVWGKHIRPSHFLSFRGEPQPMENIM